MPPSYDGEVGGAVSGNRSDFELSEQDELLQPGEEAEAPFAFGVPESTSEEPLAKAEMLAPTPPADSQDREPASEEFDMDAMLGLNEGGSDEALVEGQEFVGTPGDPLGLNDFANSEISQAKDGMLAFTVLISNIDTKEIRESLRSALDDQRFAWNPNDLMSKISRNGTLAIENVSPVKAVILINRIKRLPVGISWEQYAISQVEPSSSQ
jgi:hypothetical protein